MRKTTTSLTALLFLALAGVGLVIFLSLLNSPRNETRRFLPFTILQGESFGSISGRLQEEGMIRSKTFFYYLGRLTGKSAQLKAGEYELNTLMTSWEILNVLTGTAVKLHRITIKEGTTMFQVAQMLDDMGLVDKIQFLELCWDPAFLEELAIPSFTAEGYLFPETYYLARGTPPRKIIKNFVEMFWSKVDEDYLEKARQKNMSIHDALIMASVIEKETGLAGEMAIISSVFHNRINKGMKLQSDPTAIYDSQPYGGRVTREDLFRKTPFNTYQIPSLPLTPISNPGILSLHAALNPEKSTYLFFVSRRDGSHHFTTTYEEHQEAIKRFLK